MKYSIEESAVSPRVREVADAQARVALYRASRPQQQRLLGSHDIRLTLNDDVRDLKTRQEQQMVRK